MTTFLGSWSFRVSVNECCWEFAVAESGILQGSFRGPLFLLLYVNDPPDILTGKVLPFASDVKVSMPTLIHRHFTQWSSTYAWFLISHTHDCVPDGVKSGTKATSPTFSLLRTLSHPAPKLHGVWGLNHSLHTKKNVSISHRRAPASVFLLALVMIFPNPSPKRLGLFQLKLQWRTLA